MKYYIGTVVSKSVVRELGPVLTALIVGGRIGAGMTAELGTTTSNGTLILHLGMTGSLRIVNAIVPAEKHDHVDLVFPHYKTLRFTDPRRFGSLHWTTQPPERHRLLRDLGVERLYRRNR